MFHENHEKTAKNLAKSQSKESRPHREAYERILKKIEGSIQEEKSFNREWQESLKRLDEDEKKKQDIREAKNKKYLKPPKKKKAEKIIRYENGDNRVPQLCLNSCVIKGTAPAQTYTGKVVGGVRCV